MAHVELKNIEKVYDNGVQAVYDFNLKIEEKEFVVLVGPSGCGKTTTLRMIAGLEDITRGELYINGKLVNELPPKDRQIAMVFQNYALYPHMTVYKNLGFVLKVRKYPKEVIDEKVRQVAAMLDLTPYLDRKPKALSGGQRQRVALGRAIIRDASVYLYDEPLSNLDAKLRVRMRTEISILHKKIGATSIYVTHDQTEAMTMASRIVVMKDGYVQQIGTPEEIYDTPKNMFVAGFIGTPPMNFISGSVDNEGWFTSKNKELRILIDNEKVDVLRRKNQINKNLYIGIRPEFIKHGDEAENKNPNSVIEVEDAIIELLGHETLVHFNMGDEKIVAAIDGKFKGNQDKFNLVIETNKCHFFDAETEESILDYSDYTFETKEEPVEITEEENIESIVEELSKLINN